MRRAPGLADLLANDEPLSETLLKKAQSEHPDPSWSNALGFLYGIGMLCLGGMFGKLGISGYNADEVHGAFAEKARRELEATADLVVAGSAGYVMVAFGGIREVTDESKRFTFDHALADRLLSRAMAAQPEEQQWKTW